MELFSNCGKRENGAQNREDLLLKFVQMNYLSTASILVFIAIRESIVLDKENFWAPKFVRQTEDTKCEQCKCLAELCRPKVVVGRLMATLARATQSASSANAWRSCAAQN